MAGTENTAADLWMGDLFNRSAEADLLLGYIESICGRETVREDTRAHTIAVDAGYGEGKTFFLRRFAKQLERDHPVAFVDAWTDDLADEPLTAIAATLQKALDPLIQRSETVREKWETFLQRTGQVAKIVAMGLAKRGLGLAIGAAAVDQAGEVLSGLDDETQEAIRKDLSEIGSESVDGMINALTSIAPNQLMRERIAEFEAGQTAINDMKRSLAALIDSLGGEALRAPIIIIIDELDRCRPTYAIKLLEEVKHLFDVAGLVFLFGTHTEQLAHSIRGAYGSAFDGAAYLRRFLNRQYRLAEPDLEPLITKLMSATGVAARLYSPPARGPGYPDGGTPVSEVIAWYMQSYGLRARDAFELVDTLQTAVALSENRRLHVPYLLPLIIGHLKGLPSGHLPEAANLPHWQFLVREGQTTAREVTPDELALEYKKAAATPIHEIERMVAHRGSRLPEQAVLESHAHNERMQPIWSIGNYPRLIRTVARFTDPKAAQWK